MSRKWEQSHSDQGSVWSQVHPQGKHSMHFLSTMDQGSVTIYDTRALALELI